MVEQTTFQIHSDEIQEGSFVQYWLEFADENQSLFEKPNI